MRLLARLEYANPGCLAGIALVCCVVVMVAAVVTLLV